MEPYVDKVRQQVERLQRYSCQAIEAEVSQKRFAWVKQHRPTLGQSPSPRAAYELLFFDYMGLSPEELSVIRETDTYR